MTEEKLPDEIIQAIIHIGKSGDSAKVKYDRGVWKVHRMKLKLECETKG